MAGPTEKDFRNACPQDLPDVPGEHETAAAFVMIAALAAIERRQGRLDELEHYCAGAERLLDVLPKDWRWIAELCTDLHRFRQIVRACRADPSQRNQILMMEEGRILAGTLRGSVLCTAGDILTRLERCGRIDPAGRIAGRSSGKAA